MKLRTGLAVGSMAILFMMTGTTVFAQQDKEAKKAREKIAEGQKDLKEAKTDSAEDFQKFMKDARKEISDNRDEIMKLKSKQAKDNKNDDADYQKKVMALERENDGLEKRINNSQHTSTNMWGRFKTEFHRDMKKLGEDISKI